MEKIYGYREQDVIGLAQFLKNRERESLTKTFERFGIERGKAKGTVRNLYYALAKKSVEDKEFCNKYLEGKPLSVGRIIEFEKAEERKLIKEILIAKKNGRSVRSIIMELSGGDGKLALRYQNKFRGAVKSKPRLIAEIIEELKAEGQDNLEILTEKKSEAKSYFSEAQFAKVKREIDGLVNRIADKVQRENQNLRLKIAALESENLRLCNLLYGENKSVDALKFFRMRGDKSLLN